MSAKIWWNKLLMRLGINPLPRKPSALLALALDAYHTVKADPDYEINMGLYHAPGPDKTRVCLAGCVLAHVLGYPKNRYYADGPTLPWKTDRATVAIDRMRRGQVAGAFHWLGLPPDEGAVFDFKPLGVMPQKKRFFLKTYLKN